MITAHPKEEARHKKKQRSWKEAIIDKVRIGIIGAGRIGQLHARHLSMYVPEADVVAVSDILESAASECATRWRIPEVYGGPEPILANPKIDAVLICTGTDTHAGLIKEAAGAGKHIFCEKPIALDLPSIDRALEAARSAGVCLQIGFNRRFDPNFREARRQVEAGEIGTPHVVRITSRDPAPPPLAYIEGSGGIFLDMTIHDFDMARYIVGDEVVEVFAQGSVLIDPEIEKAGDVDTAVVCLRFRNGALGVIDNSRQAVYGYDQRLEVLGEKGRVLVENPIPHTAVRSSADGNHTPPLLPFFLERYADSFIEEVRLFVTSIQAGTPPAVSGEDGRVAVVMALAAQRSLREGRPIPLSEIELN